MTPAGCCAASGWPASWDSAWRPATAQAIRRAAPLLPRVSAERVRDEFMAILATDGARARLEVLDRLDLLCRVIPELEATRHCPQPSAHHYWDVWGHLLHCVEYAEAITAGHGNSAIYTLAPWTAKEDAHFGEIVGDGPHPPHRPQAGGAAPRHCQAADPRPPMRRGASVFWATASRAPTLWRRVCRPCGSPAA